MKIKSIVILLACLLLLSGLTLTAKACCEGDPPGNPTCYECEEGVWVLKDWAECGQHSDCTGECHGGCYLCTCSDDPSKCTGECHNGCSGGSCVNDDTKCNATNCEECVNGSCESKCDPSTESCCDGTCFNFYTHMCCGGNICRQPGCDDWDCTHCVEGECLPCLSKPSDYEELMECSGTIVNDPDWTPQPNGCSSPLGNNPAYYECGEASSFLDACNDHDTCYQTCGSNRTSCDDTFDWNLYLVCQPFSGDCEDACDYWRDIYVAFVRSMGQPHWEADQVLACACCDCE